jgi:hypothetical protein
VKAGCHARGMKISAIRLVMAAGLVVFAAAGGAQEKGQWRAASKTARSITGDVAFSASRMSINFVGYTIAQLHQLSNEEVSAVFDGADGSTGVGNIYRTDIPGSKKFMGKNTLCGGEDVEYVVTFVSGKELQMGFFSGSAMPTLSGEAMMKATSFCGSYTYTR